MDCLALWVGNSGLWNLSEAGVDTQAEAAADANHFIGTSGLAAYAQNSIALFQKANGDGMEDFIEGLVPNLFGACEINERKRQPLAEHGNVPGTEDWQRLRLHLFEIFLDQDRIVIRAGAVGTGNQDHHRFG